MLPYYSKGKLLHTAVSGCLVEMAVVAKLCMYVCNVHTYMHRYGCCTCTVCTYIPTYIQTYIAVYFAHLSFIPFFFSHKLHDRRPLFEKRVWLYSESRSVRRNTRQALDPPWSIHILNGHTDNPQVPAILPARLDAVRSSYFRLALENRVSIICHLKRLEC